MQARQREYGRSKEGLHSDFWDADGADDADFLIIRCLRLIYRIGILGLGSLYYLLSGAWGLFIFFCLDAKENEQAKNCGKKITLVVHSSKEPIPKYNSVIL